MMMDFKVSSHTKEGTCTVADYFARQFPFHNQAWIRYRLDQGMTTVNFEKVDPDSYVKPGDLVAGMSHFHEHPVLDWPIKIVYEDDV